jgi:hypothetical protein
MAKCQTPKELEEKNFDAILVQSVGVELLQIFGQIGSLKIGILVILGNAETVTHKKFNMNNYLSN